MFRWQCDDAYIAFRYVAQSRSGHGLVWNDAPFRPVEGYTSFLWVMILRFVWGVTGVAPPMAADWLSLVVGLATLVLIAHWAWNLNLGDVTDWVRAVALALVLTGVVLNRTYLMFLSSGLETALFNGLFILWLYECIRGDQSSSSGSLARLSSYAMLAAVARPEGLLCVLGSVARFSADRFAERNETLSVTSWLRKRAPELTPLIAVVVHILWRRAFYGEWLPNTYFAKATHPWPEMGRLYIQSFALEYGLFAWLPIVFIAVAARVRSMRTVESSAAPSVRGAELIAVIVVLLHLAFYVVWIGGDHFEYRVLSYMIPLLFLIAARLAFAGRGWPRLRLALLASCVVCSLPIPIAHHLLTKGLTSNQAFVPVAPSLPKILSVWSETFDLHQRILIQNGNGVRRHDHALFLAAQFRTTAERPEHRALGEHGRFVISATGVGVPGWVFPKAAIIDLLGLNDRVVARNPHLRAKRYIAHERQPPPGYVECFRPQAEARNDHFGLVAPRPRPVSDAEIRACEARDW